MNLCPECESGQAVLGYSDNFGTYGMRFLDDGLSGTPDISWNPQYDTQIYAEEIEQEWYESLLVPVIGTVLAGLLLYWITK